MRTAKPTRVQSILLWVYWADETLHSYVSSKFPKIIAFVDSTSRVVHVALSSPYCGVVCTLLAVPLALTKKIDIVVVCSVILAWAVSVFAIARSDVVQKLTIPSRLSVLLVAGVPLVFMM